MRRNVWLSALMAGLLLGGCAGSRATFESQTLPGYAGGFSRLLVLADLGPMMHYKALGRDDHGIFVTKFTDALGSCGIGVEFRDTAKVSLDGERGVAAQGFRGDAVLFIVWKSEQTGGHTSPYVVYTATLIDLRYKQEVWKSRIGFTSAWYRGDALAAALVEQLQKERILSKGCVIPEVPPTLL